MLVVPMRTPEGETIGALQLINCKPDFSAPLTPGTAAEGAIQRFTTRHEQLAGSLASQAAVAIQNRRLYESIRELFEGFVKASVTAIESRDPTTSGHSARVANLTVGLATAIDRSTTGPYQALRFTAEEMTELRYAALLHDFGKVGVREQVLVKAKKLLPGELDRIRQRVELIKRGLELRYSARKIEHLEQKGRRSYAAKAKAFDAELAAYVAELDRSLARIVAANEPAVLPRDFAAGIERLALDFFEDHLGNRETVITRDEAEILAIPRGSLTPAEFKEIKSHVIHTYEFLTRIPWTREFRRIPEIARSHHEKLDGSGYPEGRRHDEIPVQSRMMTIADIYDALTAGDRPYKKGIAREEALDILEQERRAGHLDGALLDVFVEAKIYEQAQQSAVNPSAANKHRPTR
jgi:HD-GYP domain-containing protein (c-di-GMP phosphodiesterase class II)